MFILQLFQTILYLLLQMQFTNYLSGGIVHFMIHVTVTKHINSIDAKS